MGGWQAASCMVPAWRTGGRPWERDVTERHAWKRLRTQNLALTGLTAAAGAKADSRAKSWLPIAGQGGLGKGLYMYVAV